MKGISVITLQGLILMAVAVSMIASTVTLRACLISASYGMPLSLP
ncbi:hypothetical protein [Prevotella sp. tc2-28]|nr:hypothetical protein [Prevotella sp. tc2-28]